MAQRERKKVDLESEKILEGIEKVTKGKEPKKDKKKEKKKETKKVEKAAVKKESWWHGVKSEFKKVRWPNRKEMVKYSIATIIMVIVLALFFIGVSALFDLLYRLVQGWLA